MGRVFFSVRVGSVRTARCSCPGRCYLSCRVPSTASLQAPSGLGCARVLGEAAGGAVGPSHSGTGGFLSGPTFQALGSWKDCVGAPPGPDVLRANSSVGEGCPQKLETANLLRFLLLVLIPCICALIVLLAILLSFVGACMNITHSQCQILPYHSTLAPILPIVKNMDMEKFLKFFTYLHRLSCYQHILLFGCSLAFPECIVDGDDRRGLLPCRSFCEAAKEGCESVLGMVNFSWPDSLRCSQFTDHTENSSNVSKICFSLQQEHGKQCKYL
ncbi:Atrial natriuretic peptide-converting enzyme [Cricetulus griseus]|uniref:Atrial natriuretic peptide-converting enzyme n=1 Tax=Cricetulus griseus TaxID=10029 RepID=G3IIC6_CRIGR|nr:Atrial natriuretic peptide-converting enzyme [Cricetulus griseus]